MHFHSTTGGTTKRKTHVILLASTLKVFLPPFSWPFIFSPLFCRFFFSGTLSLHFYFCARGKSKSVNSAIVSLCPQNVNWLDWITIFHLPKWIAWTVNRFVIVIMEIVVARLPHHSFIALRWQMMRLDGPNNLHASIIHCELLPKIVIGSDVFAKLF